MKTYLLIYFILLFYSISSVTKEECQQNYEIAMLTCKNNYEIFSSQLNCEKFMNIRLLGCLERAKS